jgi:AcrR family transcriptional regulator
MRGCDVARVIKGAQRKTKIEQREASLEKLLSAARQLFVSKGYASTTLEEIAATVDMTKGSVYFYFGSKEAVLLELLNQAEQIVIDPVLKSIANANGNATDKLVAFLHHQAELGVTDRENMLLIILMSLEFEDGPVARKVKALYRKFYDGLNNLIREGQKSGEFRTDAPSRELVSIIVANHDGTFLEWYRRSDELSGPKLVKAMRGIIVTGLTGTKIERG